MRTKTHNVITVVSDQVRFLISLPDGNLIDPTDVLSMARRRNVLIETKSRYGSGIRLGGGLVLTAHHIWPKNEDKIEIKVNGQPAEVLCWSKKADLMLLKGKPDRLVPIKFQTKVSQLMPAFWYGNPLQNKHLVCSCSIMGWKGRRIYFSGHIQKGTSGCGLYAYTGELLGMVFRDQGFIEKDGAIPCAVSATRILKFLQGQKQFAVAV